MATPYLAIWQHGATQYLARTTRTTQYFYMATRATQYLARTTRATQYFYMATRGNTYLARATRATQYFHIYGNTGQHNT